METKHVTFGSGGGGGNVTMSMSGQHFAPPASSNMVSMKGGGSSASNMVSMKGGGSSASNMVSMKGGGSSAANMITIKGGGGGGSDFEKLPVEQFQLQCVVDEKEAPPADKDPDTQETKSSDDASFSYSNDGGMLFSTS